jgi:hypothetical protein
MLWIRNSQTSISSSSYSVFLWYTYLAVSWQWLVWLSILNQFTGLNHNRKLDWAYITLMAYNWHIRQIFLILILSYFELNTGANHYLSISIFLISTFLISVFLVSLIYTIHLLRRLVKGIGFFLAMIFHGLPQEQNQFFGQKAAL